MADFASMKVAELRAECEKRGLATKGTKAVLLKLLASAGDEEAEVPAKATATVAGDAEEDYSKMALPALKAACKAKGLPVSGSKAAIIERLKAAGGAEPEAEEAEAEVEAEEEEPAPKKGRKAAPAKKGGKGKKRAREDEEEAEPDSEGGEPASKKSKVEAPAAPAPKAASGGKKTHKVDAEYRMGGTVYQDYDAMLNQTNIGGNNNKYYVIQVIQNGGSFVAWNRWGRVGEKGQNKAERFGSADAAIKSFEKKFKDKTKNDWSNRANFKTHAGKYTLMDMAEEEDGDADIAAALEAMDEARPEVEKSKLDTKLQALVKLIFDPEMFTSALKSFKIDTKKMPLGKISVAQIKKGNDCLEEIQTMLKNGTRGAAFVQACNTFYTLVPHDFGRQRPPPLDTLEMVQEKFDLLAVLSDIEKALEMQKEKGGKPAVKATVPNPIDVNYGKLDCDLELLDKSSDEWKMLEKYTKETRAAGGYRCPEIIDIFKVNRHTEPARFAAHDKTGNRRLLWHGTNVAVVAAILQSGLRIMPHAGGRVGRGLYFASENLKSAGYVRAAGDGTGIMFLNEVVLGREHHITRDDPSFRAAPKGFDSVVAVGRTEPDPSKDIEFEYDGHTVVVPQGKAGARAEGSASSFAQTEYLVYREDQVRIRYLLKMKF